MSLLVEEEVEKIKNFSEFYSDSFIDVLHRVYQDSIKEVEQEDYYQSYLKICNNTATLMRDLGIDDPMLAVVFSVIYYGMVIFLKIGILYLVSLIVFLIWVHLVRILCVEDRYVLIMQKC